jgi:hypothetical protein
LTGLPLKVSGSEVSSSTVSTAGAAVFSSRAAVADGATSIASGRDTAAAAVPIRYRRDR